MQVLRTRDSFYANEERSRFCHVDASTCVKCLSWGLCSRLFNIFTCKVDLLFAWAQPYKRHMTNILFVQNAMILLAGAVITLQAFRVFKFVSCVSIRSIRERSRATGSSDRDNQCARPKDVNTRTRLCAYLAVLFS